MVSRIENQMPKEMDTKMVDKKMKTFLLRDPGKSKYGGIYGAYNGRILEDIP